VKKQCNFFCSVIILLVFWGNVFALENNISGNARIAGMGFTQVVNDSGLFSNPAGFTEERIVINISNSELFETGVIYNYLETGLRISEKLIINFGYESVVDRDQFDNSGYGQRLIAFGVAAKMHSALQVGVSLSQSKYMLFENASGSGYSLNIGVGYGPKQVGKAKLNLGFKIDDMLAQRTYKSKRTEMPQTQISLGGQLRTDNLIYAVDLQSDSFRFGLEYQVIPALALRAGFEEGQLTLGVGISRGPIKIDYAYWLAEVGATHRISTGLSF